MKPLIVEDDKLFAELVAAALGAKDALFAENMAEAMAILKEEATNFVILDLSLPDSDSIDTIEWIRKMKGCVRGLTIIVLTGDGSPSTRRIAIDAGADRFFVKGEQDAVLSRFAAIGARFRDEPCAAQCHVEQIERKVNEMTGRSMDTPKMTGSILFRLRPLLMGH